MLELLVAGLLVLVLSSVSYRQYMGIVVDAEQAAFSSIRGWLQAGVNLAMSDALGRHDRGLAELEGSNPMRLLDAVLLPPSNYLGELRGAASAEVQPGHWYFDLDRGVLYYRFRYRAAMQGFQRAGNTRVGFRLKSVGPSTDNKATRIELLLVPESEPLMSDVN